MDTYNDDNGYHFSFNLYYNLINCSRKGSMKSIIYDFIHGVKNFYIHVSDEFEDYFINLQIHSDDHL